MGNEAPLNGGQSGLPGAETQEPAGTWVAGLQVCSKEPNTLKADQHNFS